MQHCISIHDQANKVTIMDKKVETLLFRWTREFPISTTSPLLKVISVITTRQCPRSVFQLWKEGEGVWLSTKIMIFFNYGPLGQVKKRERAGVFFCYLLFPFACFLYTLLPSPVQGYVGALRSNINRTKHWLNTSLFNFDTHKGLTVKIYIILVCKQQQWALQVKLVGFCSKNVAHKK